jgi:hypothetical protein
MPNNPGEDHEDVPNDSGQKASTAILVIDGTEAKWLLADSLAKLREAPDSEHGSMDAGGAVAEVRRVRRGRFFLSTYEQRMFGSFKRPIFDHYCHGVVVGETSIDLEMDGIWCYGAHNDFELIPEFTPPGEWPIYVRTENGFSRKDSTQPLEAPMPSKALTGLLDSINRHKRLT